MERHVLVVLPHPDDETFGCGGTIALFAKSGVPVTYVCGTLGQMGRNMGRPFFATRESLSDVREAELEEACNALGIQQLIKLGLRDKTVEFENVDELAGRIARIVRELKPSLVITHYPGFAVHPDHNALGDATIRAIASMSEQDRPTVHALAFPNDVLDPPDVAVDISSVADTKMAAIRAHRSQSAATLAQMENADFKNEAAKKRMQNLLEREFFWTYRFS